MRKILYGALSLFVVWFASTACFPIYVGTNRPEVAPCQTAGDPNIPCVEPVVPTPNETTAP
jgi:hypothetical protein